MSKQITIKLSQEEAKIVQDILEHHQLGYSLEFPPERIVSVRNVIKKISQS
jgi:hypothetical protein